ncbi:MAG: MBOAT family protein [Proteobacteria bacterium]|nr:MBOAT family protein [Pseudomonadota bacterium]MBU1714514.1 MBOAT family protein [Pseudomonadota bacterium]
MQFDSLLFLLFFLSTLGLYYALPSWRAQKVLLLAASYVFYGAYSPPLIFLIWFSTLVDYVLAKRIDASTSFLTRKFLLISSLVINLGLLGYFKYAEFILNTFSAIISKIGIEYQAPEMNIILPIGISFYTFQTISYTIDVYRKQLTPSKGLLDFALYVTFFPQLVAGPIVRASHFLPQCIAPKKFKWNEFFWGLTLLLFGLFVKIVLADTAMAPVADAVFSAPEKATWLDSWVGTFAFSGQIFFDFSGYSLCAIGTAICLGFSLPDNFRSPYAAIGFADFWHRWHISLSTWLRDYLYISIGGNRSTMLTTDRNLLFTMLLAGLWHGASWHFVLWGGLHGLFLGMERFARQHIHIINPGFVVRLVQILLTFITVSLMWVVFRLDSLKAILAFYRNLLRYTPTLTLDVNRAGVVGLVIVGTLLWHGFTRDKTLEERFTSFPAALKVIIVTSALVGIGLCSTGDSRAFIYFQF